jgi:hypothetical protein
MAKAMTKFEAITAARDRNLETLLQPAIAIATLLVARPTCTSRAHVKTDMTFSLSAAETTGSKPRVHGLTHGEPAGRAGRLTD